MFPGICFFGSKIFGGPNRTINRTVMIQIAKITDDFPDEYLTLVLMRHAKSDWSEPSTSDHERPLSKRGRKDAMRMGEWLQENDLVPDLALCSTASRTKATLEIMMDIWSIEPKVINSQNLYLASQSEILRDVNAEGLGTQNVMVLAHNPGLSQIASMLAAQSLEMSTASAAVFDVAINSWDQLCKNVDRRFRVLMRPKALSRS